MRESLDITLFNAGIISNPDIQDVPENAASDSNNIDGDLYEGKLGGIPTASLKSATLGFNASRGGWIKLADGTYYFVYAVTVAKTIKAIKDFYGTPSASSLSLSNKIVTDMLTHNQEIYVAGDNSLGMSNLWIGKPEWGQFGGAAPTDLVPENAEILAPSSASAVSGDFYVKTTLPVLVADSNFETTSYYTYGLSYVYDGLQESPIRGGAAFLDMPTYGGNVTYYRLTLACKNGNSTPSLINKRLTAIKLYRKEKNVLGVTTLYQHLQTFDTTKAIAYGSTTWDIDVNDKIVIYDDYNNSLSATYEANSGMPETLESSYVDHEIHTELDGYMFIARCSHDDLPDASHMVFRSKEYRYSMYNWINDYLRMPIIPTAIKSFQGRLFAFDENHIYRITSDLVIEDVTEGVGCSDQRSIVVTDYGMFWCDRNNAYWHNGETIIPIGDAIKSIDSTKDWHGFTSDYEGGYHYSPIVVYDAEKHYVMFGKSEFAPTGVSNVWAWHVVKRRWDKWLSFSNTTYEWGLFIGKDGESYVADGTNLNKCFGGTTKRPWYWVSKEFDFGDPSQLKQFYKFFYDEREGTSTTPVYTYGLNGATPTTALVSDEFKSGGEFINAKTMKIKIVEAGLGWVLSSISMLFRRFWGKR